MRTFTKVIKVIGITLWIFILAFFHIIILASNGDDDGFMRLTGIALILIWWILTVGVYVIYEKITSAAYGGKGTHYKKPIPKRSALAVRAVLYTLWLLSLIVLHFGILITENIIPWIIFIAVWWAAAVTTQIVASRRDRKREAAAKAEYEEKYVSEIEIDDELLGKMKFTADTKFNELESKELHLPPFGAEPPGWLYVSGYKESDRKRIIQALRDVYAHKDEIIEHILPDYLDTLGEYEENDDNGEPYTLEKLRKVMTVHDITVVNGDDRFSVSLELSTAGENESELGGHGFIAVVDFHSKSIYYDLEG